MRSRAAAILLALLTTSGGAAPAQVLGEQERGQQREQERETRDRLDRIERKIDSQLLRAIDRRSAPPRRSRRAVVDVDEEGRALVDIRARVATHLISTIERMKGTVVSKSLQHRSVIAWVPLRKLKTLAAEPTVDSIEPAPQARGFRLSFR